MTSIECGGKGPAYHLSQTPSREKPQEEPCPKGVTGKNNNEARVVRFDHAAQALYDHADLAKDAPLGNQSLLALQFRGPGAAPTPMRTRAWLIEVRDWHRCFCLLSQARYEQQRNKDRASTAHAK